MAVTIYGIRNCDTMKKARAWLEAHGVEYEFQPSSDGRPCDLGLRRMVGFDPGAYANTVASAVGVKR